MSERKLQRKAWGGLILIILGILFLIDNLNIFPYFYMPDYIFRWYSIFVIIGAAMMASGRKHGLVFLLIGGFFLIPDVFNIRGFYWEDWWPIILVAIGISILLRSRHNPEKKNRESADENYIDDMSIFGGSKKVITAQELEGGKITAVFGGSELDLTNANLAHGDNVIDVFILFGGTNIRVPADWTVRIELTAIFGGFSDDRRPVISENPDNEKVLVIKGFVMFGGGDIKST